MINIDKNYQSHINIAAQKSEWRHAVVSTIKSRTGALLFSTTSKNFQTDYEREINVYLLLLFIIFGIRLQYYSLFHP